MNATTQTNVKDTKAFDNNPLSMTFHARESVYQEWKLVTRDESDYYLAMGWQVKQSYVDPKTKTPIVHLIGKGRKINSAKSANHDAKIGSFCYNYAGTYTVKYGRRMTSEKKTLQVVGKDLLSVLRSIVASGDQGILVNDMQIYPKYLGEPQNIAEHRKVNGGSSDSVDPVINNHKRSDDQVVTAGKFSVVSNIVGTWTWFDILCNGQKIEGYTSANDLLPNFSKNIKTFYGMGAAWSPNQNRFYVKTTIPHEDLATAILMSIKEQPVTDSAKEATIIANAAKFNGEAGDVLTVVKSVADLNAPALTPKPATAIDEKIDALRLAQSLVDNDTKLALQSKIDALLLAKSLLA